VLVNRWIRQGAVCLNGTSTVVPVAPNRPQKPLATGSQSGHLGVSCRHITTYIERTRSRIVDLKLQNAASKLQDFDSELGNVDSKIRDLDSKLQVIDSQLQVIDSQLQIVDSELRILDSEL